MTYKYKFSRTSRTLYAVLVIVVALGSSHPAWADTAAASLGGLLCNAFNNSLPFGSLFQWIAYLVGVVFAIQGVHHFRGHSEDPRNHPLHRSVLLWGGAACLLSLPSAVGAIMSSLLTPTGNGTLSCDPSGGGGGAGGQGLDQMISAFVTNIENPLLAVVSIVAILAGLWMMVHGFIKASRHGFDPRANSVQSITANLVFGCLLMTIGDNLNMMLSSIFGDGITANNVGITQSSVLQWGFVSALGGGSTQFATAVASALTFFQLIGAIAFVRGWLIMKKVVEGGGNVTMAQGITHIVGGVLAVNIAGFLTIMDATFGTNMLQ